MSDARNQKVMKLAVAMNSLIEESDPMTVAAAGVALAGMRIGQLPEEIRSTAVINLTCIMAKAAGCEVTIPDRLKEMFG